MAYWDNGDSMAYDEKLADMWRKQLADADGISEKPMMGGLCFLHHGNMLGTTKDQRFMFRVGKGNERKALKLKGARRVVMGSREMAGFVHVDAVDCDASAMKAWVKLALKFVAELPPK